MKIKLIALATLTLAIGLSSANAVSYSNDFSDPSSKSDFTFYGVRPSDWTVTGGALIDGGSNVYTGPSFAILNSLSGLTKFVLEVDVQVASSNRGSDFGHTGVVWGFQNTNLFNIAYLRTHSNHFTAWDAPYNGEITKSVPGAVNGQYYHLRLDVDHDAKKMSVTVDGNTLTLTGAQYDTYSGSEPGKIGLMSWGENVSYDNLRITSPVPDSSMSIFASLAIISGLISVRRFTSRKRR